MPHTNATTAPGWSLCLRTNDVRWRRPASPRPACNAGNGAPDRDMADSPLASHTPDIAALVDHEEEAPVTQPMRDATEILRHLVADVISEGNARPHRGVHGHLGRGAQAQRLQWREHDRDRQTPRHQPRRRLEAVC